MASRQTNVKFFIWLFTLNQWPFNALQTCRILTKEQNKSVPTNRSQFSSGREFVSPCSPLINRVAPPQSACVDRTAMKQVA